MNRIQFSTNVATGSAGTATATGYSPHLTGKVLAVHVAYVDSPPAGTTDFTLSDEADPAAENITARTNAATDYKDYPRRKVQDNAGADVTYDGTNEIYEPYVVYGRLKATIAQANAGDSVTVTVWVEG